MQSRAVVVVAKYRYHSHSGSSSEARCIHSDISVLGQWFNKQGPKLHVEVSNTRIVDNKHGRLASCGSSLAQLRPAFSRRAQTSSRERPTHNPRRRLHDRTDREQNDWHWTSTRRASRYHTRPPSSGDPRARTHKLIQISHGTKPSHEAEQFRHQIRRNIPQAPEPYHPGGCTRAPVHRGLSPHLLSLLERNVSPGKELIK